MIFLAVMIFASCIVTNAQNVNYSQYSDASFFLNPALVASKSEVSLSIIHRSQPLTELLRYNTSSVMLVTPLLDTRQSRRWGGWGLSLLNDEVKGGLDLRTQGISGAYAYNLPVAQRHYFSFGAQAGYYQRTIALNGLSTSSQWVNTMGYVPGLGMNENMEDGRKNFLSLSTGFLYYMEDDDQRHIAKVGVAAGNINQPSVSLTSGKDIIPLKISAHGSVALLKSKDMLVQAEMLFYRENYLNTYHVGARASYYFENKNPFIPIRTGSVDFKAGYRVNNAITTEMQFHQPNFTVAFAYDFGIASNRSYRSPNDVVEILFSLRKIIGSKKRAMTKRTESYSSLGKVREFYFGESASSSNGDTQTTKAKNSVADTTVIREGTFKLKHDFKFGFNEASLNEESKAYLDDMVVLLKGNNSIELEVIGHTDNVGSSAANKQVSMDRAQVVIDYLIRKGIDPVKLKATAKGAKEPLMPNDNEANRALNRRVEFVIYNR